MRSLSTTIQLAVWLLVLSACTAQPLEEGDRDLVLKIGQLQPYGLSLPPDFTSYESFKRERWIDGSVMIEYEFEAPEELGLPYLYSIAERHPSNADACMSFSAGNLGARLGGIELSERNDLFQFGDKSRFGLLVAEGNPYGNYFGMCRGKTAFMVMLGGFYFDDGDTWGELLGATLDAVDSMN
jgi:hypothetical protein